MDPRMRQHWADGQKNSFWSVQARVDRQRELALIPRELAFDRTRDRRELAFDRRELAFDRRDRRDHSISNSIEKVASVGVCVLMMGAPETLELQQAKLSGTAARRQ